MEQEQKKIKKKLNLVLDWIISWLRKRRQEYRCIVGLISVIAGLGTLGICARDLYSQFRGDGGVPWHRFGGQVIVAVGAVEKGLSPLAVTWEVGVEDQARAGGRLGVQGAAAGRGAILHVEAANRPTHGDQDEEREKERSKKQIEKKEWFSHTHTSHRYPPPPPQTQTHILDLQSL